MFLPIYSNEWEGIRVAQTDVYTLSGDGVLNGIKLQVMYRQSIEIIISTSGVAGQHNKAGTE